ncbi:MAG: hypothetical protein EP318_13815 [Rhodobacteraceae bacterium]|nr:MAG: hypothetical protein EP318_13815 [Paracoccaceae bacterium]
MLACVIFGALAGVFSAVHALRLGMSVTDAFAAYLVVSVVSMVGLPLLCLARGWLLRRFARGWASGTAVPVVLRQTRRGPRR